MVASGLVSSLARPGGNTTGISILATGLNGKRQEILIEAVPRLRHMGALADSNNTTAHDKTRNAKTTVCEVSSTSISDKITAFAMKVRLHNNRELNGSRRRAQAWTAKQIVQRSPSVFLTRLVREAERLMQANGSMFRRASKLRRASNRASIA